MFIRVAHMELPHMLQNCSHATKKITTKQTKKKKKLLQNRPKFFSFSSFIFFSFFILFYFFDQSSKIPSIDFQLQTSLTPEEFVRLKDS